MKQEAGTLPALILLIFSLFEYIPEIHTDTHIHIFRVVH